MKANAGASIPSLRQGYSRAFIINKLFNFSYSRLYDGKEYRKQLNPLPERKLRNAITLFARKSGFNSCSPDSEGGKGSSLQCETDHERASPSLHQPFSPEYTVFRPRKGEVAQLYGGHTRMRQRTRKSPFPTGFTLDVQPRWGISLPCPPLKGCNQLLSKRGSRILAYRMSMIKSTCNHFCQKIYFF